MTKELGVVARIVPLLGTLLIVAFYVGVSVVVLPLFDPASVVGDAPPAALHFESAYNSLLAWAALSCCAIAVGITATFFAGRELWRPHPSFPYALGFATMAGAGSLWLLHLAGNTTVDTLRIYFCGSSETGLSCASRPLLSSINLLKTWLNGAFQVGAIFLVVALLEVSACCARSAEKSAAFRRECAQYDRLFLTASVLLTLVIFTDVLFLSFARSVLPSDNPLIAYQEGLVIYFAVVSSMVLALTLVAAAFIGHPLAIPGVARTHLDATKAGKEGGFGGLFESLSGLLKAPSTTKAVAAFAPLVAGLLGPLIDLRP